MAISKELRQQVYEKYDGRCAYCGCELNGKFQVDHINPKYWGGVDAFENLNPACASCNNYKHAWSLESFRKNLQNAINVQRRSNSMFRILERFGIIVQKKTEVEFYFESNPVGNEPTDKE